MTRWIRLVVFLFLLTVFCFSRSLWAEIITEVSSEGTLTLEDGNQVSLAGIEMDEEGVLVLRVLALKQDVKVEILENVKDDDGKNHAYVYLKAKFLDFPFKPQGMTDEEDVMLNEFLIRLGAAKINDSQEFSEKNDFSEMQEEARVKGEGIWSYAES